MSKVRNGINKEQITYYTLQGVKSVLDFFEPDSITTMKQPLQLG